MFAACMLCRLLIHRFEARAAKLIGDHQFVNMVADKLGIPLLEVQLYSLQSMEATNDSSRRRLNTQNHAAFQLQACDGFLGLVTSLMTCSHVWHYCDLVKLEVLMH